MRLRSATFRSHQCPHAFGVVTPKAVRRANALENAETLRPRTVRQPEGCAPAAMRPRSATFDRINVLTPLASSPPRPDKTLRLSPLKQPCELRASLFGWLVGRR